MIQSLYNLRVSPRRKFKRKSTKMYPKSPFSQNILFLKISGHWCFLIWNDSFRLRADLTASSGMEIKLHLFLSTTSTCGLHFPHPIILINLKYISVSFFFSISLSLEDFCPFFRLQTSRSSSEVFRGLQIFSLEVFSRFEEVFWS